MSEIESQETKLDINELRKLGAKDVFKKWKTFAEQPPKTQLKFWFSFYKPIVLNLFWALFPALAIATLMKYGSGSTKYTDWEIAVITLMTFISVRVNNVYNAINNANNLKASEGKENGK